MLRNVTIVVAALLIAVAPSAQSTRPQFEVASSKLATTVPRVGEPMGQLSLDAAKGRFLAKGMMVKVLLRYAFIFNCRRMKCYDQ